MATILGIFLLKYFFKTSLLKGEEFHFADGASRALNIIKEDSRGFPSCIQLFPLADSCYNIILNSIPQVPHF